MISVPFRPWSAVFGAVVLLMGCNTVPNNGNTPAAASNSENPSSSAPTQQSAPKEAPASAKVAKEPKERESREGEVLGKPAANSKFNQVKIGMGMKQVTDLIGQPTDQGAYITGKAWIPFYYGPDRYRHELLYKGQGRLVFSGGGIGNLSSGRLSRVIHNADEPGYR